ncbi:MAG: hypothetical protein ACM3JC_03415 [Rudaea sp.]
MHGTALTFERLVEHARTVDGNAVLDLGNGHHMTPIGVVHVALHADGFMFGP